MVAAWLLVLETRPKCVIMVLFRPADQQLHGVETGVCHSEELGFRLSRFNGSSWISFRSQHSQQFESKSGDPVDGSSQRCDAEDPDRWVPEEVVMQSSEQPHIIQKVPMVVPSRAWVDEVKTLKQGDIYVGKEASKVDPSFWYKVSKFGRESSRAAQGRSPRESTIRIEGA